jgi:hypothetical protein
MLYELSKIKGEGTFVRLLDLPVSGANLPRPTAARLFWDFLRPGSTAPRKRISESRAALASQRFLNQSVLPFVRGADMTSTSPANAKSILGPYGTRLSIADLTAPDTQRWVIRRKAEVVTKADC